MNIAIGMNQDKMIEVLADMLEDYRLGSGTSEETAATVLELMRPKRLAWQRGAAVSANGTKYIVAETDFDDGAGEIWYIYVHGKAAGKLGQHNSDHSAQAAAQAHADAAWLASLPLGDLVGGAE
jgi:hypothetical protein